MKKFAEMEEQVVKMQGQINNQERIQDQAQILYNQGLLKQLESGEWVAVDSYEEQQAALFKRQQETGRTQQLQ